MSGRAAFGRNASLETPDHSRGSSLLPVPTLAVRVVDVYPYRLTSDGPAFLLLRRAPATRYAGQWRMSGG